MGRSSSDVCRNEDTINGFVFILPYIDQAPLYNQLSQRTGAVSGCTATTTEAFGAPRDFSYFAWGVRLPALLCPSSPDGLLYGGSSFFQGQRDYGMCMADTIANNQSIRNGRGIFGYQSSNGMKNITDGTSTTILLGEKCKGNSANSIFGIGAQSVSGLNTSPAGCLAANNKGTFATGYTGQSSRPLGALWASGLSSHAGFNTVLPPNSPTCLADAYGDSWALVSAQSYHTGGVHVLMADGAVRFVSENIDTGNVWAPEVTTGASPYGVWGALGTMGAGETVGEF